MLKGESKFPSMSKSSLLLSPCSYWATEGANWFDESRIPPEDTVKRDNGTVFHSWMDYKAKDEVPDQPLQVTSDEQVKYMAMYQHACKWLEELPYTGALSSELVMSLDMETGHASVHRDLKDRNYGKDGRMWGTSDLCWSETDEFDDGWLCVGDWKTGESDGAEYQLLTLCYALYAASGKAFKHFKTYSLFVNEDGVWPTERHYTVQDLELHFANLSAAWLRRNKTSLPVFGMHCTKLYCPALAYCPKVAEVTEAMAKQSETSVYAPQPSSKDMDCRSITDQPLTDEQAGFTVAVISAAERRQKYLKEAMKNYAKQGGRVSYGGYVWEDTGRGFRWHKA